MLKNKKQFDSKYEGKYIALKSFRDETIVAFGKEPERVVESALEAGVKNPVLVYIPKRDIAYIY